MLPDLTSELCLFVFSQDIFKCINEAFIKVGVCPISVILYQCVWKLNIILISYYILYVIFLLAIY